MVRPVVIGVGGFTSNVGKTTLVCELLKAFPGWEAIKVSRGHYRSCGKDPKACCVSPLLGAEPVVRSGWHETYQHGKDTARYWDAGASNVHWLIATDEQIAAGIQDTLARVKAPGVIVEGNSFGEFVDTHHFVMVRLFSSNKIKSSARRMMKKATAIYVSDATDETINRDAFSLESIPLFTPSDLFSLVGFLKWNRSMSC